MTREPLRIKYQELGQELIPERLVECHNLVPGAARRRGSVSQHIVRQVDPVRCNLRLINATDPLDVGQEHLQLQGGVRMIEGGVVEGRVGVQRGDKAGTDPERGKQVWPSTTM